MVEQENITVKMVEIAMDILRRISCQRIPSGILIPYHYRNFVDPMKVAMALVKRVKKNSLILEEPSGAHSKLLEFIRTIVVVECPDPLCQQGADRGDASPRRDDSYQAAMVTGCDSIISYEKRLSKPYVYLLENGIHIY